ncbi:response regulator [Paenibacillus sp. GCM10023248]|uniref:response regulator n=1 Tax=Bacillales TaxID=1385 RepID=UPI00237A0531|nr:MULTISPECIES: response regulator [Bacillales]MDD9269502.1 response regulator [Paenibacillus sp. MAHUQ-63]MDR6880882.1 two-component system response regulator YesN [Bacillus sp. 3255]
MQNILVVDDEAIQRRVLAKMIREARPHCHVLEAKNGKDALEVIRTNPIDIVFTDIKMPVLDGLEMIEQMNASAHPVKVIILSGYRHFEYAQKAIRLGAFDYLVKPIKEKSITHILDKAEGSITREKTNQLEKEQIKQQLDQTLSVYWEQLLNDWITEGVSETKGAEIRRQFSLEAQGIVVTAKIEGDGIPATSWDSGSCMKSALLEQMESAVVNSGASVSFYSREDKRLLLTVLTFPNLSACNMAELESVLKEFAFQGSQQFGISLTIGVGQMCSHVFEEAKQSCEEALTAASFRYFLHDRTVFPYSEISRLIRSVHYNFGKEEELFKESIRKGLIGQLMNQVDEWFTGILQGGLPQPEQWIRIVQRMISSVAVVMRDFVSEQDYKDIVMGAESQLFVSGNYEICKEGFMNLLLNWMDMIQKSRSRKHESVVEACLQYVEAHYMEDLSLDTVAASLFFSPNYLTLMFKQHLGTTFSKYLSEFRMKKALELLQNSDLRVYEIAPRTGFKDDKYFYRVFKNKFGITPDEYRRNNHLQHMSNF